MVTLLSGSGVLTGPRIARRTPEGFDTRPYTRFTIHPCTPTIGAEVDGISLKDPLDTEIREEIHRALLEWKVLFFRNQDMTRDEHREFASHWGSFEEHPFFQIVQGRQTAPDVVTLAKDATLGGTENAWHADLSWHKHPSYGAILRAIELPEVGGDTLWADTSAAHDLLPQEIQERIAELTAVHDWVSTFGQAMGEEKSQALRPHFPQVEHPVVCVHPETGRRSLFVNPAFTQHIVGMEAAESAELLAVLYATISLPECQVRFRWSEGAVAFWDNRSTQHYASSDYYPARRVMDRISIIGSAPCGPA